MDYRDTADKPGCLFCGERVKEKKDFKKDGWHYSEFYPEYLPSISILTIYPKMLKPEVYYNNQLKVSKPVARVNKKIKY